MATRYLGADFDIHMGGTDLQFPHHENEIAQWEAATGTPFARMWVHNGMLTLDQTKMSKSVGNIISLAEAIDRYGAGALRMFYLRAHYRRPVDFSEARLDEAAAAYERLAGFVRATAALDAGAPVDDAARDEVHTAMTDAAYDEFRAAMNDDLATPRALAAIFDLVATGNQELEAGRTDHAAAVRDAVVELAGVLGFDLAETAAADQRLIDGLVGELVALREEARQQRDFATSDRIRERLRKLGIELADSRDGPRWHVVRL
jgi:cysteinyl-tRNA synthetase